MLIKEFRKSDCPHSKSRIQNQGNRMPSIRMDCAFSVRELNRKGAMSTMVLDWKALTSNERDEYQLFKFTCDSGHDCTEVLSHREATIYCTRLRQTLCSWTQYTDTWIPSPSRISPGSSSYMKLPTCISPSRTTVLGVASPIWIFYKSPFLNGISHSRSDA